MKLDAKEQDTFRQYLLGQLPQEGSARLEERLLAEGAVYEALLIAEEELIDEYLSEKLASTERQSFEAYFLLAPERQQKLRFGRAFHKYVGLAKASQPQEDLAAENASAETVAAVKRLTKRNFFSFLPYTNPIISYSLAAAVLLIVGGLSWAVFNGWRQAPPHQPGNVYVVKLTPGLTRDSGELKRLLIPPGTDTVHLRLILTPDEAQSYRAELLASERASLLVIDDLKLQSQNGQRFITFTLPTKILKRDDYQVRVSGRSADGNYEEIAGYQFRVVE